jgi:hypothetical protein
VNELTPFNCTLKMVKMKMPSLKRKKKYSLSGCWWLTPVTLATQQAEIRRITVGSQPGANSSRDPTSKQNPLQKKKKRADGVTQGVGQQMIVA